MKEASTVDSLLKLAPDTWRRNRALHLPASGAARPWLCRGFTRPLLVVLPDSRQARDFLSDADSMREFPRPPATISAVSRSFWVSPCALSLWDRTGIRPFCADAMPLWDSTLSGQPRIGGFLERLAAHPPNSLLLEGGK